jgi:hypothetical protein
MRLRLALVLLPLASVMGGCAANSTDAASVADGEDQEAVGAATVLEAKLYDDARATPNASCDRFTNLKITKSKTGKLTAKLENRLGGTCELYVAPNPRSFKVTEGESCGSKVYEGTGAQGSIVIQDHRTRMCEDLRPSVIEVEEKTAQGSAFLFGKPTATAPSGPAPVSKVLDVKLYDQPNAQPSAFCDRYTKLVLGQEGDMFVATLNHELSATSACEIAVMPDPRSYTVVRSESCGSKVYKGSAAGDSIEIQDHHTRLCEDLRAAAVEVSETRGGTARELFSTR